MISLCLAAASLSAELARHEISSVDKNNQNCQNGNREFLVKNSNCISECFLGVLTGNRMPCHKTSLWQPFLNLGLPTRIFPIYCKKNGRAEQTFRSPPKLSAKIRSCFYRVFLSFEKMPSQKLATSLKPSDLNSDGNSEDKKSISAASAAFFRRRKKCTYVDGSAPNPFLLNHRSLLILLQVVHKLSPL